MTKRLSIIVCLLSFSIVSLYAQDNLSSLYHPHASTQASYILPAKLGMDEKGSTLILPFLPNLYTYAGNNFLTYRDFYDIWTGGQTGADAIDATVPKLHRRNSIATGADYDLFHLYLKFGIGDKGDKTEILSMDFFMRARTREHFFFSDDFAQMAWYGNQPYAGTTVDMNPMGAFGMAWMEYGTGAAFNVVNKENFKLRVGGKGRFLTGYACVKTDIQQFDVTTEQDGKYVEASTQYKIYTAYKDGDIDMTPLGLGFAGDLGATANIKKNFEVSVGLTDFGYIKYNKEVITYSGDTSFQYQGVELKDPENSFSLDTLKEIFQPVETHGGSFSSPLGAKITIQGAYKTGFKTTKKKKRTYEYARHTFFFTYVQGIQNRAGSITHPYISGAYNYNVGHHLSVGGFLNYGGFYRGSLGIYTSAQFGFFRWGVSFSNLSPLIFPDTNLGAEVAMNMSFAF